MQAKRYGAAASLSVLARFHASTKSAAVSGVPSDHVSVVVDFEVA